MAVGLRLEREVDSQVEAAAVRSDLEANSLELEVDRVFSLVVLSLAAVVLSPLLSI